MWWGGVGNGRNIDRGRVVVTRKSDDRNLLLGWVGGWIGGRAGVAFRESVHTYVREIKACPVLCSVSVIIRGKTKIYSCRN